jgi:hypothetical protein
MGFMNALFHGIDFRPLQRVELHPWRAYLYVLCFMALWAFAIGAFFAAVHNTFARVHLHRRFRHA